MKLGLLGCLGDTHGNVDQALRALAAMGPVAAVVHCGDNYRDAQVLAAESGVRVFGVVGNCDQWTPGPAERMVELGGHRIFVTHGHQYWVKRNLDRLVERARVLGVAGCVFGHTHSPLVITEQGILFVNPGSPTEPRGAMGRTCAVIDCGGLKLSARIVPVMVDEQVCGPG